MAIDWSNVPSWIGLGVASVGAFSAVHQLKLSVRARREQVQIARANLLLSIDGDFESPEMYKSRLAVRSLRNRSEENVLNSGQKDRSPEGLTKAIEQEYSHQLNNLWKIAKGIKDTNADDSAVTKTAVEAANEYTEIMALANWIETIGMLCCRNLVYIGDVLELYDVIIINTIRGAKSHIETRRTTPPFINPDWLGNALWILPKAEEHRKRREARSVAIPAPSPTDWS